MSEIKENLDIWCGLAKKYKMREVVEYYISFDMPISEYLKNWRQ